MKIAVAQLVASTDKQENLKKALDIIAKAKVQKADLVVLPETFMAYMPEKAPIVRADIAEPLDGPFVTALSQAAQHNGIYVVCGIYENHPEDMKRCYNTVVVIDDQGKLIHSYRKTHLYDAFSYCESDNIIPGDNGFEIVETKFGKLGVMVCYELRFPEISRTLALKGAEILLVPTAWVAGPMKEEHIQAMAKSRALENTVYLCVADQTGNVYSGRSVIFNPMGITMASCGDEEGVIFAEIDCEKIQSIRKKLPCLSQRRPELYQLD